MAHSIVKELKAIQIIAEKESGINYNLSSYKHAS
jgi:hypothetical protein